MSKVNTATQIVLAGSLAVLGFDLHDDGLLLFGSAVVAALTVASGALYLLRVGPPYGPAPNAEVR